MRIALAAVGGVAVGLAGGLALSIWAEKVYSEALEARIRAARFEPDMWH